MNRKTKKIVYKTICLNNHIKYLKLFPLTSLIVEVELEVNSSEDKLPLF